MHARTQQHGNLPGLRHTDERKVGRTVRLLLSQFLGSNCTCGMQQANWIADMYSSVRQLLGPGAETQAGLPWQT